MTENEGTNPKTCRHNVVEAYILKNFELSIVCFSCRTDLTNLEQRIGKNYEYDSVIEVWVHVPKRRKEKVMSEYEEEQKKLRLEYAALPHSLADMPVNMDWGQWFVEWAVACESFHRAYRDEKTCSTVLGSIVANQQRLMKNIPPAKSDSDDKTL